ncbi:MAG: glycine--tRNA ligase subunit beta, partial [Burkholderiales bacterium]
MARSKRSAAPKTASLLVELLTEELPPKSLAALGQSFAGAVFEGLVDAGLVAAGVAYRRFATPRRLAVLSPSVRDESPATERAVQGPPVGAPPAAIAGFARKNNVAVEALERRQTPKGEVFVARVKAGGASLDAAAGELVEKALKKLPIAKLMRWGAGEAQFVRPVHRLVMLHGSRLVPGSVLGLASGNRTQGHRFMGKAQIALRSADEYESRLRDEGRVIADFDKRRSEIAQQLSARARELGASLGPEEDRKTLLGEVSALVEWPSVYPGGFDRAFHEVPQE